MSNDGKSKWYARLKRAGQRWKPGGATLPNMAPELLAVNVPYA